MPARNKINDLRDHLFATLEALQDDEKPMDIERAKAIADVAKVIVDSAKVEVAFIAATSALAGTGFIPAAEELPPAPAPRRLAAGVNGRQPS
jgi:hypothetical protein